VADTIRYPQPDRLIAIGDIHGDGYALKQILQNMKVINDKSEWIGGKTMVVLLGDV